MAEVLPPPIHRICGALQDAHADMLHHVHTLRASTDKHVLQPLTRLAGNVMAPINLKVHGALAAISQPTAAALSSHESNGPQKKRAIAPRPVLGDLGMSKSDITKKLSNVPLYTVTNSQRELVVVSSEKPEDKSQEPEDKSKMVIFFFNKEDAKSLVDRIRRENEKLARDAKVQEMTADLVYEFLTSQRPAETSDVRFRLMPDKRQVKAALRLYSDAGQSITTLRGVPVFQAEDLSVTVDQEKFTPVFFSKDDLDEALGNAHTSRKKSQAAEFTAAAAKHQSEVKAARKELQMAKDEAESESARKKAEDAQKLEAQALDYAQQINDSAMPQVEVACFEDVLSAMNHDKTGKWSQLLFIPPGAMAKSKH